MSDDRKTGLSGLYDELYTEALAAAASARGYGPGFGGDVAGAPRDYGIQIKQHLSRLTGALVDALSDRPEELWSAIEAVTESAVAHLPEAYKDSFTLSEPKRLLHQLHKIDHLPIGGDRARPVLPLCSSQLLANRHMSRSLVDIISSELRSADRVDIIMAFIRTGGVNVLYDGLRFALDRGVPIRVVTSTYFQGSDAKAIETLHAMGVQIRINLQPSSSDLHAKGWLFGRDNGYSTALIGSSNMSKTALSVGREWNLRISEKETPHLIRSVENTFELGWYNQQFTTFDPETHSELLHSSLTKQQFYRGMLPPVGQLEPRTHQQNALDALDIERETFGHDRNLIVSATGTGKTVTSAFDYARLCKLGQPRPRLLYVAHRQEILQQALNTFRRVLNDQSFGELWVGEHEAERHTHLFASVQLLAHRRVAEEWPEDFFDIIIIDEFHHAAASSYRGLLTQFKPQQVIGLTATPERLDGQDIREFFDGRTAYSLRLWDALDDELLTPFHYFGVSDSFDLRHLRWSRNQYDPAALEQALVGNTARLATVLTAIERYVDAPDTMRALGFCVSILHAKDMAERFTAAGYPAVSLTGESSQDEREGAIARLVAGKIRVIFTVDLFNEGVDIPQIDTILFLRPTQSVTLFTQQLGRGLRLVEGKESCVVLDFIGQHRAEYGYENVYSVFSASEDAAYAIRNNFPNLPPGCLVHLEPIARDQLLSKLKRKTEAHLKEALFGEDWRPLSLQEVLENQDLSASQFYGRARFQEGLAATQHEAIAREPALVQTQSPLPTVSWKLRVSALVHIDDDLRLRALRNVGLLKHADNHPLLNRMLLSRLSQSYFLADHEEALSMIAGSPLLQQELVQLADVLARTQRRALAPFGPAGDAVLSVHGTYTRIEVAAALLPLTPTGHIPAMREGVRYNPTTNRDIFFVTINKDEALFTPSIFYHDAVLSPTEMRWQSQNSTSPTTGVGQRYVSHSSEQLMFARSHAKISSISQPFFSLGAVTPISHRGEKPITFELELASPMPQSILHQLQLQD